MIPGGLFVTGTDTGVGKSVVSATLTLGLNARYWKPVQAGTTPATDTELVRAWTGLPASRFLPEVYRLREAASPHTAARKEGERISLERIVGFPQPSDRLVVTEGAGGLLVPLNANSLMADLIEVLGRPVLLVARTGLGTLNHTLLSIAEMRRRTIPLLGVVLNGDPHEENEAAIAHYGDTRIVGRMPLLPHIEPGFLRAAFRRFDLRGLLPDAIPPEGPA